MKEKINSFIDRHTYFLMLAVPATIILAALLVLGILAADTSAETTNKAVAEPKPAQYEVLNVQSYVQNETNGYGAITGSHRAYAFTYIDGKGTVKEEIDFENLEYGSTKVKIGDHNYYEIKNDCRTLYLTKDTFKNIETK